MSRLFDVLILADDFTGGCDTAAQFASPGRPCRVVMEEPGASSEDRPDSGVRVIDTETRHLSPARAASTVRRMSSAVAIDSTGWRGLVYKKIDSTLRGNIAAEIEALARVFPRRVLVVAPAFPATGRTTRGGICLVNGVPVDETEFARDARSPVRSARIADTLRFTRARHCDSTELAGLLPGVVAEAALVVDAETDSDLERVASLVAERPARYIAVGSAGLAAAIARLSGCADAMSRRPTAPVADRRGREAGSAASAVLGLVGSQSERSRRQARLLREQGRVAVVMLSDAERAIDVLAGGGQALVMSPPWSDHSGQATRDGDDEAAARIAGALAAAARRAVEQVPGVRLFLTGGDTALAVVRALGAGAVDVHGQIVAGVPAITIPARVAGRRLTVTAVTKAGGFGDDETMARAFGCLREMQCWR